jgi:hypothetical protein
MARRAKKKTAVKVAAKSPKTKKAIAVKSAPKAKKPAAKKPAKKAARRSAAETAKLQKAVIKGLKAKKSAATLAAELGISRPYVYFLKYKG